eukprot:8569436-Alexandrium_andersonii.AAC.1
MLPAVSQGSDSARRHVDSEACVSTVFHLKASIHRVFSMGNGLYAGMKMNSGSGMKSLGQFWNTTWADVL